MFHKASVKHLPPVQMMLLSAVERLENQIEIFVSICKSSFVIDSYEYHVITELFMIQQRCFIFHSFQIIRNPKWFIFEKSPLKIAICFENKRQATSLWIFHWAKYNRTIFHWPNKWFDSWNKSVTWLRSSISIFRSVEFDPFDFGYGNHFRRTYFLFIKIYLKLVWTLKDQVQGDNFTLGVLHPFWKYAGNWRNLSFLAKSRGKFFNIHRKSNATSIISVVNLLN